MSIELLLIPIAISIAGSISKHRERKREGQDGFCLETRFKDPVLLESALAAIGCASVFDATSVGAAIAGAHVRFERDEDGVFAAWFFGEIPVNRALTFVADIDAEYVRQLQQQIYRRLVERAHERGLLLETEEVLDDSSILLTFAV